jgi:hypothetical protein
MEWWFYPLGRFGRLARHPGAAVGHLSPPHPTPSLWTSSAEPCGTGLPCPGPTWSFGKRLSFFRQSSKCRNTRLRRPTFGTLKVKRLMASPTSVMRSCRLGRSFRYDSNLDNMTVVSADIHSSPAGLIFPMERCIADGTSFPLSSPAPVFLYLLALKVGTRESRNQRSCAQVQT